MMERQLGRESQKDNDLFYTCSLIDYIARKTKNKRVAVVDNIERVSDDFIEEAKISVGNFDNVGECQYAVPSHWDIGKVYKRLIKQVALEKKIDVVDAIIEVYHSFISDKIDDYNSSVYYENPSYIFECFIQNKIL